MTYAGSPVYASSPDAHQLPSATMIADFRGAQTEIAKMFNSASSFNTQVLSHSFITSAIMAFPPLVFNHEQEHQLAGFVRETAIYYSGLTSHEIRVMAYVYAVCNSVQMPASWTVNYVATRDWCAGFLQRHNIPAWMITP